ncbi:DMT family transporter [Halarchaeum sp. P4]|uniref:DMT family transporter n=1 Tax=Halarchaeum sp. P4 TaxID=3421639 RepID=UPI003EBF6310
MLDRFRSDPGALAPFVLVLAILAGGSAAILIRWSGAPTATQVFYRLFFTTAAVAPVAYLRHREAFRAVSARDLLVSVVSGVILAGHFLVFFKSVNWTTVAAATTLTQLHAAIVPLGAFVLLDERVSRRMVAGLTVALAGVALLSTGGVFVSSLLGGPRPLLGNSFAVLAAIGFAGYTLAGRSVRQRLPLFPYVTVVYAIATLAVGVFAVGTGVPIAHPFPLREWLIFLGLAAGPGLLTHTGFNWSLEHVDASVGSAAMLGTPVVSTLLAALLLDEVPSVVTLVGGAVALTGVYFVATGAPGGNA